MAKEKARKEHGVFWKEFFRTIKYFLVAASAGLIQFGVCTIFDEVAFRQFDHQFYWVFYFIALVLSVVWNFTINRSVTFKSVGNVPKAMAKVIGYYFVFTPLSLLFARYAQIWGIPEMLITVINILINGVTEYLFMRLFVFRNEIDTRTEENTKPLSAALVFGVIGFILLSLLAVVAVILAITDTTIVVFIVFVGITVFSVILFAVVKAILDHKAKTGRRRGDRKDAKLIRDIDALHIAMAHSYPNRTDNEAYISVQVELDPIKKWIDKHPDKEFKYTFFHLIVAALLKLLVIRPKLNRFICNRRFYQKNERSIGFIVKRQFTDEAKEAMAIVKCSEKTNVFDVHESIKQQVIPAKKGTNSNGIENALEMFRKMPNWLVRIIFNVIRHMSDKGRLPNSIIEGDSNHCSGFVTNLGSIGLKCGYHHLANYGTSSIFIVIGEKKMTPFYDEKGKVTLKETLDVGLTIDERIADGYYYAKSVKIFTKVLQHPELLELPFDTEVEI